MYWDHEHRFPTAAVPRPGRHADGRGLDGVRPAGLGAVCPPVRLGWPAGRRVAAAGLGRRAPGGLGAATALALSAPDLAGRGDPGRGDRGSDDAVHGRGGAAAAGHRQRAGVPRAAGRGRRPRPGRSPAAVASARRGRGAAAHPALARRRRPGRDRVRPRRGRVLGRLHPAHPGGRRRTRRPARARGVPAGGRGGGHARGRPCCHPRADPAAGTGGSRPGAAGARSAVQPGDVRAAVAEHRGLRHLDVPGACHRRDRRGRGASPSTQRLVADRRRLRGGRGHRRGAHRCPGSQRVIDDGGAAGVSRGRSVSARPDRQG
jgi:hypothetical protein